MKPTSFIKPILVVLLPLILGFIFSVTVSWSGVFWFVFVIILAILWGAEYGKRVMQNDVMEKTMEYARAADNTIAHLKAQATVYEQLIKELVKDEEDNETPANEDTDSAIENAEAE